MPVSHAPITVFGRRQWRWFHEPPSWTAGEVGLTVTTGEDTDFWRTTHYGFVRDTGHALLRMVGAEFRMTTTFSGEYRHQYDQAGLILRQDEHTWVKTGIEFVDGLPLLSAVVTREVSDWSVVPLTKFGGNCDSVTVDLQRISDTVTIRYGWNGGDPDTLLRIAYFPPGIPAEAGPMCASPEGTGFTTHFTSLSVAAV